MTRVPTYVVDASVAVKWYLPEEGQEQARALAGQARDGRAQLMAPELLATEVANAAWKRQQRGELLPEEACEIAAEVQKAPLTFLEVRPLLLLATHLATTHGCTVYDALYLAVAEAYDTVVITADRGLGEKAPERVRMLGEFGSLT